MVRENGTARHDTRAAPPLEGEWTLAGFCEHLAALELWPEPPECDGAWRSRRWAFESAALDLAVRQAARSLHDVLGLMPEPMRFVNSLGLGKTPSIEPVRRRPARSSGVRSSSTRRRPGRRRSSRRSRPRARLTRPTSRATTGRIPYAERSSAVKGPVALLAVETIPPAPSCLNNAAFATSIHSTSGAMATDAAHMVRHAKTKTGRVKVRAAACRVENRCSLPLRLPATTWSATPTSPMLKPEEQHPGRRPPLLRSETMQH